MLLVPIADNSVKPVVSREQEMALQQAGFIRVDGLIVSPANDESESVVIRSSPDHWGHYDYNQRICALTTLDGQIWITFALNWELIGRFQVELCPNGPGCHVPLSNGEMISPVELLRKAADPHYMPQLS